MSQSYKNALSAEGWWQCGARPREALTEIQLFFYERDFSGSGIDSRGFFQLNGTWLESGRVAIRRRYFGLISDAHLIGEYDGEGTMWGTWSSDHGAESYSEPSDDGCEAVAWSTDEGAGSWLIRISGELKPPDQEAVRRALARTDAAQKLYQQAHGIAVTILSKEDEGEETEGEKTG